MTGTDTAASDSPNRNGGEPAANDFKGGPVAVRHALKPAREIARRHLRARVVRRTRAEIGRHKARWDCSRGGGTTL